MVQEVSNDTENDTNVYAIEQIEQAEGAVVFRSVKKAPTVHRTIKGLWTQKSEVFLSRPTVQDSGNDNVPQNSYSGRSGSTIQHQTRGLSLSQFSGITHIEKYFVSITHKPVAPIPAEPIEISIEHNEVELIHSVPLISKSDTTAKKEIVNGSPLKQKFHNPFKTRQMIENSTPSKHIRPENGTPSLMHQTLAQKHMERGKTHFKRNAQAHMSMNISKAPVMLQKLSHAVAGAAKSLGLWLAGIIGGVGVVMILGVLLLFSAVAASPLGILFSGESNPGSVPLSAAVSQINIEFDTYLSNLQNGNYTSIETTGSPPDWVEVIAVFASHTAGAENGMDVALLDAKRVELLRNTFWDMCSISTSIERIEHLTTNETTPTQPPDVILYIKISAKPAEEMRMVYSFSDYQNEALDLLLAERISLLAMIGNLEVSQENAITLLEALPDNLSPERRAVVQQALSLVGKVNYFWGGKSLVIGWDNRWGQLMKVTAPGSRTTGTFRPYGLDCSGFVDWVFYNVSGGDYVIGHGGGAGSQHRHCTDISWHEAQPGDLAFYDNDDHIGIVGGWDENGNILIIHCASGQNNVVITGKSGFIILARPMYYSK